MRAADQLQYIFLENLFIGLDVFTFDLDILLAKSEFPGECQQRTGWRAKVDKMLLPAPFVVLQIGKFALCIKKQCKLSADCVGSMLMNVFYFQKNSKDFQRKNFEAMCWKAIPATEWHQKVLEMT